VRKQIEGSRAVAEVVALCRPEVICAYSRGNEGQRPDRRPATTPAAGEQRGAKFGQGKNLPLIAMAHHISYVATASAGDLRDPEAKVEKAIGMKGARYLHVHVPCPLGWGSAPHDTIKVARAAMETGLFPVRKQSMARSSAAG
jgi:pyruvate/2-oxoacid:ferredoxin oxidoreductase beta subunit